MKFQPFFSLSVSFVICSGAWTAGTMAQIAEKPNSFKISEPPMFELPPSPWDTVSPYQDGLPALPPGHDTTLLSGSGIPKDKAYTFRYLKELTKLDKDPSDLYHGFGKSFSVFPSDDDWQVVNEKEPQESPWNLKEKYHVPESPRGPRKPDAAPDRPLPEQGEGRGKPEELQRRIHHLEKELEASRRREAALRVVVKDLIEQMPPSPPAITFNPPPPPLPPPPIGAAGGSPSQLYLQGHLTMSDGMGLELRNDYVGAYNRFKEARDLFDAAFAADPEWEPEVVKFRREKIRQQMEGVRKLEIQRRQNDRPPFLQNGQDGLKRQSGQPGSTVEHPQDRPEDPPPPPPHAPPHAPQEH